MLMCGKEFTGEVIERIQKTIESEPAISRRTLARRVCEWLEWKDLMGRPKEMSCRVALLKLQGRQVIVLPEGGRKIAGRKEVAEILPISSCGRPGNIALFPVEGAPASRIWNSLMEQYHYLGAGPLCGAQIRYLARDASGWVGALAFSAAAWRLHVRDSFIGWTDGVRAQHLSQVVCNSRFLVLPRIPHLASHLLSLSVKRIGSDWQHRYGYRPLLLETYVEKERFQGTCYKAANWHYVGTTRGRGRQDREHCGGVPVKDVYVYPLTTHAVRELRGTSKPVVVHDWAEEEFGAVTLPDARLSKRLVALAREFYARPQASIPEACGRAGAKAAYRFFDHHEARMDTLLQPHYDATLGRTRKESIVLAVQDTTTLNYNAHPACVNLGPVGYHGLLGLLLHDTMAFTPEGTPLGLLDAQLWARDPEDRGKKTRRHEDPIEEKESYKWVKSFEKVALVQKRCRKVTFVSVGDREADFYELFDLALGDPQGPKLLVRAAHNRRLAQEQGRLWEKVAGERVSGVQEVQLPRRGKVPARVAKLEVRFAEVTLKPSRWKRKLPPLTLWAVLATEVGSPEPIEWMLLTTCNVATFEEAVEKLSWYTIRWGIEIYHRTLKSGCKIEERQLGHADRIEACLAIDMVVAWRIHQLTKLGRETPDVPCTVFFEEAQWKALAAYVTRNPLPPPSPPPLREATRMVASLGGFLARKGDGEPGTKALWIGLQRLGDLTEMWKLMTGFSGSDPPVSSTSYG